MAKPYSNHDPILDKGKAVPKPRQKNPCTRGRGTVSIPKHHRQAYASLQYFATITAAGSIRDINIDPVIL